MDTRFSCCVAKFADMETVVRQVYQRKLASQSPSKDELVRHE